MLDYNKTTLIGGLTKDVESRTRKSGEKEFSVAEFTVAVSRRAKSQDEAITDFIPVEFSGGYATNAAKLLKKGSRVFIEGRMHIDEITKDGVRKWFAKVRGNEFIALDSKLDSKS
jgi:single-strand DNA-binding protein